MIAALLAAVPLFVHAQQLPLCNINRDLGTCRLAPGRNCPGGCIRPSACPTSTVTSTKTTTKTTTKVNTVTATRSAGTITITGSGSASTITVNSTTTVTASTNSSAPPSCKTEAPYANLFAFPDWECKNETDLILNLPARFDGLVGPQIKFNTLAPNLVTKYNESACTDLLPSKNGARSVYFTLDGYPKQEPFPGCTMDFYTGQKCSGDPESRLSFGDLDSCRPIARNQGSWKSVQFKCAYIQDVCTDNQILLGTCPL
jgi:hypothetical protein